MTPSAAQMLLTTQQPLARDFTLEIAITTLSLLLHLPTLAPVNPPSPARWAIALMASLSTPMSPTIQQFRTYAIAREVLEPASPNILDSATKAMGFHELRARRARTRMTKKQTIMTAIVLQRPITNLAARMG
ncbi:hypothetical protein CsSME_00028686 [Camellia sinensis var. sinensis]